MKKSMIAILMVISLFPTLTFAQSPSTMVINNNKVKLTLDEYNELKEKGYTDSQIMFFDQEIINRNLNSDSKLVKQSVSYLKTVYTYDNNLSLFDSVSNVVKTEEIELTKEQYEFETSNGNLNDISLNAEDTKSYGYRVLTTSLYKEGTYSSPVYRVVNVVQWDDNYTPKTRSFDILGISFANTNEISVKAGSQYAFQTYTQTHKVTGTSEFKTINYSSNSDHYTKRSNGYAIAMNLVDDTTWYKMSQMNSYLEYTVIKTGSNVVNNLQFRGAYVHAQKTVELLDVVGFAMDPSKAGLAMFLLGNPVSEKYDSGNKTFVQMTGIGW